MPKLVFIEGVSGVGKTTMVRMLAQELRAAGMRVEAYAEFDFRNPIDFYCTAYLRQEEYEQLCGRFGADKLVKYAVRAGDVFLVRYYNEDTSLFEEPLLHELAAREFCYHPKQLVSLAEYTAAYRNVWSDFAGRMDDSHDIILFDGSLLHHPINDMMRNYGASAEQAAGHVGALLDTLGNTDWCVFYLKTEDIRSQLTAARAERGQAAPTDEQAAFWVRRYENDMAVLARLGVSHEVLDVSHGGWDAARRRILEKLQ